MMILPPISDEQTIIINHIGQHNNVSVEAVAGSGKTTTSLYIAHNYPNKKILLLTYNAKLKMETREKVQSLNLHNMEVHNYHSFCVKYYNPTAYKDQGILELLEHPVHKKRSFVYDIIIVDEAQDMTMIYYRLVQKIITDNVHRVQMVVMGDRKQSIYDFNKADYRFLTLSKQIFDTGIRWVDATLSKSYRITHQMADLLNEACGGISIKMFANKSGSKPRYLVCNPFSKKPFLEVMRYLNIGYKYDNIYILAPSVRSEKSPVRVLANMLTQKKIPIYVPTSDEEKLDTDITQGKIVFSTYHQVKGLERQVCIVFSFDNSYFEYYACGEDECVIPNAMYVAITRATDHLILIHDKSRGGCGFLETTKMQELCDVIGSDLIPLPSLCTRENSPDLRKISVTDLVKFIPTDILQQCRDLLHIEKNQVMGEKLDIPIKTKQDELYEGVSEITGVVIPSYFEYTIHGKMSIVDHLHNETMTKIHDEIHKKTRLLNDRGTTHKISYDVLRDNTKESISCLLRWATEWCCSKSGFEFKKLQIKKYEWITNKNLQEAVHRLRSVLMTSDAASLEFEVPVVVSYDGFGIFGFIDILKDKQRIFELKVVSEVDTEHFLQVAVYTWMAIHHGFSIDATYVLNVLDNSLYTIGFTLHNLEKIINILILYKKNGFDKVHDEAFVQMCLSMQ